MLPNSPPYGRACPYRRDHEGLLRALMPACARDRRQISPRTSNLQVVGQHRARLSWRPACEELQPSLTNVKSPLGDRAHAYIVRDSSSCAGALPAVGRPDRFPGGARCCSISASEQLLTLRVGKHPHERFAVLIGLALPVRATQLRQTRTMWAWWQLADQRDAVCNGPGSSDR
jgi:hypothetical protein